MKKHEISHNGSGSGFDVRADRDDGSTDDQSALQEQKNIQGAKVQNAQVQGRQIPQSQTSRLTGVEG